VFPLKGIGMTGEEEKREEKEMGGSLTRLRLQPVTAA